ncbi:MAG: amidohydrolase family protein [Dehalococcoidales bacterium]|nr:amidohydrolase family protein [Dehalococcoidales bacterium]
MIIDFHTHIVPLRVKQNRERYALRDTSFAAIYRDPKAKLATAEDLMAAMDKSGVEKSVALSYGWRTLDLCIETNSYIMEAVARYPKRLIGFCTVPLKSSDKSLNELERCLKAGACGIGEIRPDLVPAKNRLEILKPIAELAEKYRAILLTHSSEPVGHVYPGKGTATPDILLDIIRAFPELKIVCAHWGGGLPFYALMPEVKIELKNVYFDTAASPFLYSPEIYRLVMELVGEDKILFGTDYPLLGAGRYFREIENLRLPPATSKAILGGNATRLLGE